MSYGKFGLKMPINNYNPRMSEEWNTGAAIGNLLGTLWGVNYQKRGDKKTYEAAQDILNNMGKQEPASDSLYQDYSNLNISAADPNNSVINKPNDAQPSSGSQNSNGNATVNNAPSLRDIAGMKKIDFKESYIGKYKDDPNIVGNTIGGATIADTVNRNLKNLNTAQAPSFKAADMRAAIRAELMKSNKPATQIDRAMELIEPQILAKEEEYNKNKSDELYELYKASNGKDMNALANIAKINPALAKFAYDDFVYNRNRQDKLADMETARKEALAREERAFARQQALLSQRLAHDAQKAQPKVKTLKDVVDGNIDYGSKEYKQMVSDYIRINAKEEKTDDDVKRLAALEKKINSVSDSAVPLPTSPEDKQAWVAQVFADGKKEGVGVKELKDYLLSQVPQYSQDYFALQKSIDAVINDPDFY